MTDASVSRLAQARIIPPIEAALFPSPSEAMRDLVAVGASHLARTRLWHFGGVKQEPNHIVARLGYETKEETDLYDDAAKDFRHGAVLRGRTVKFVIRLADLAVVYARRRAGMTDRDFTSGLRFMLRAGDHHRKWDVVAMDSAADFGEWAHSVDLVHRFRYRAAGPEIPADHRSPIFQALALSCPELMTIDLRAKRGVDVDSPAVEELVRLARGGLGDVFAVGRKNGHGPAGEQTAWVSEKSAERVVREVPVDPERGDTDEVSLLRLLSEVPLDNPW
jgi:hypothetical protein